MINSSSPSASRSAHQTAWPHCTGSAITWRLQSVISRCRLISRAWMLTGRINDDLKAVPGLDRCDERRALLQLADLHFACTFEWICLLVSGANFRLGPVSCWIAVQR